MERTVERRQHERFRVEDGSLAMLWPASSKIGQIIDIGMGGLAFRYTAHSKPKNSFAELESEIELICNRHRFNSDALPIETVSDFKIEDCGVDLYPRQQRRRNLKFGRLSDQQKSQVEYFIQRQCLPTAAQQIQGVK